MEPTGHGGASQPSDHHFRRREGAVEVMRLSQPYLDRLRATISRIPSATRFAAISSQQRAPTSFDSVNTHGS